VYSRRSLSFSRLSARSRDFAFARFSAAAENIWAPSYSRDFTLRPASPRCWVSLVFRSTRRAHVLETLDYIINAAIPRSLFTLERKRDFPRTSVSFVRLAPQWRALREMPLDDAVFLPRAIDTRARCTREISARSARAVRYLLLALSSSERRFLFLSRRRHAIYRGRASRGETCFYRRFEAVSELRLASRGRPDRFYTRHDTSDLSVHRCVIHPQRRNAG